MKLTIAKWLILIAFVGLLDGRWCEITIYTKPNTNYLIPLAEVVFDSPTGEVTKGWLFNRMGMRWIEIDGNEFVWRTTSEHLLLYNWKDVLKHGPKARPNIFRESP